MRALICLALSAALALARELRESSYTAKNYVAEYGRKYSADEESWRLALIEERLADIRAHPASSAYTKGVNEFTDRSPAELGAMRGADKSLLYSAASLGVRGKHAVPAPPKGALRESADVACGPQPDVFSSCDWRDAGVVTPPKNQGSCGSCWAFASIETLESHWAIASGKLVEELSEQQILDCAWAPLHSWRAASLAL
jgi:cathepsin L